MRATTPCSDTKPRRYGRGVIKYIGSKRLLVPQITQVIRSLSPTGSVIDLFSGTARVGHGLKAAGHRVLSNDLNRYAHALATCYVQADRDRAPEATRLLAELNALPGVEGYFTQTFCRESRYVQPKNGRRVDAIRSAIAARALDPELEAILLVALMQATDRVDSTTGVQMAYLKSWSRRSHNDLELRLPDLLPQATGGKGAATCLDALAAAKTLSADVAYLDPPYNQHKYIGNYHVWETLVRWDAPETYGIANKRVDCKQRKSPFNSKPRIRPALTDLVDALDVRHLVVSFSNEGFVTRDEMVELLSRRGQVHILERAHDRYVGARIGIYSPGGAKVGSVGHLKNTEYLFVVPQPGTSFSLT